MNKPRSIRWSVVAVFLAASLLAAQDLPLPPTDGVRDDTRALSEKAHAELSQALAASRAKMKAEIWFTSDTFLPSGQNLRAYARNVRIHWSGNKDSLIMAYDRSSDSHLLSFSPSLWNRYPSAEIIDLMQVNARLMANKAQSPEDRLLQVSHQTFQRLAKLEKEREQSSVALPPSHLHLGRMFALGLAGGAFGLFLVGTISRKRDVQAAWESFFPSVQVGTRFGALHGGGVTVESSSGHPHG